MTIIEKLRNHDNCHDEAANMLEFLLSQFQSHSLDMGCQHRYRFRNGGWPMQHLTGSNVEAAIQKVMKIKEEDKC